MQQSVSRQPNDLLYQPMSQILIFFYKIKQLQLLHKFESLGIRTFSKDEAWLVNNWCPERNI